MARPDRRARLRAIVRYLKAQREVVSRGAVEHARWVKFIAESASLLRASPSRYRTADGLRAHKYAAMFDQYIRFVRGLNPPDYCVPLHGATIAWLESLAGLAMQVSTAIAGDDAGRLEAICRVAGEPQRKLAFAQRTRADTLAGLRKLFDDRPRPAARAKPANAPWPVAPPRRRR